jgi:hypothetical protein
MAEEELASNLILASFSSPTKNSCEYSNIGFFDMNNLPTESNTPCDDANESIDQMFPVMHKIESMGETKAF